LYPSPGIIKIIKSLRMRREGHMAKMGQKMNVYRILLGNSEGEKP
jgi:hypothetical protein